MKKAVFVSTTPPFPVDEAKKVTVSGFLKFLCDRYGAENVSYVLVGLADSGEALDKRIPCKLLTLKKPAVLTQFWNIFGLSR